MAFHPTHLCTHLLTAWLGLLASSAHGQFDASRVKPEPPAISQRFASPSVRYNTPSMADGRMDFASHAEVLAFAESLAKKSPQLTVRTLGNSQAGLPFIALELVGKRGYRQDLPTVLILGQQHGNEPAGGEAALAIAQLLSGAQAYVLERVNVLIIPRANPDGAERFSRATQNGMDVNRDHLLLNTPEAQHIAAVGDRWVAKFGVVQKYDALLQAATVGNLHAGIADAALNRYLSAARTRLTAAGQQVFWYHTASTNANEKTISMGGVQPDTGRNVSGLRNAISILLETRGVGIGKGNFARRVHSHVIAAFAIIETAAEDGDALLSLVQTADLDATKLACKGDLIIDAQLTPSTQAMTFLDAVSGEDKMLDVQWRSALALDVKASRPRPCGYLLKASEGKAIDRLQQLGVEIHTVIESDARWALEEYAITAHSDGQRQDARGAIAGEASTRFFQVTTRARNERVAAGDFFISLAQANAGLIAAALEPDSQNSYAANRLLDLDDGKLQRVMRAPPATALRKP
jgi:Zinc carboxypeptidase